LSPAPATERGRPDPDDIIPGILGIWSAELASGLGPMTSEAAPQTNERNASRC